MNPNRCFPLRKKSTEWSRTDSQGCATVKCGISRTISWAQPDKCPGSLRLSEEEEECLTSISHLKPFY